MKSIHHLFSLGIKVSQDYACWLLYIDSYMPHASCIPLIIPKFYNFCAHVCTPVGTLAGAQHILRPPWLLAGASIEESTRHLLGHVLDIFS